MIKYLLRLFLPLLFGAVPVMSFSQCNTNPSVTYTIQPTAIREIYIVNGMSKPWKGGDTLKIPAGVYDHIEIDSFGGDQCRDIIIINSGGLVSTKIMRFKSNVHHVKVLGSGSPGITYGFKTGTFGFDRVNHFTMERIECGPNPNGVGIYGKVVPEAGKPWLWYPAYTATKVTINNCYVHDIAGEGMYIGHTYPGGDPDQGMRIPQRMDSVTISNNIVTNTGWDGIQLSNARNGCMIFGNTVSNFGLIDKGSQRAGIISGGNTNAQVFNNIVTNGTGNGIQFFGYGKMNCYNNTVTNVGNTAENPKGEESFYARAYINSVEQNPKQQLSIYDNVFNQPKPLGAIRLNTEDNNSDLPVLLNNKFCFTTPPPANWQSLYIILPSGYTNVNNTLSCGGVVIPKIKLWDTVLFFDPTTNKHYYKLNGKWFTLDGKEVEVE